MINEEKTISVVVLLSTYNGSKYIKEQIQSIVDQDYDGVIEVCIRDDGSKDDTVDVIKTINVTKNRKLTFLPDDGNLGPQRSFLRLIDLAPHAEFYFFADQDDVWTSDHVSAAVAMLQNADKPVMYCSNYSLVDANLKLLSEFEINAKPQFTPLKSFFYNQIPGCCMAWNDMLQRYLKQMRLDNVMMHDRYVLSFACFIGEVFYDPQSHILHRIHGDNVIGAGHKKINFVKWIKEKYSLLSTKEKYDVSKMAEEFLRIAEDIAHEKYISDIKLLRDFKKSRKLTHKLLSHPDSHDIAFGRTEMSIRSKIRLHLF